MTRADPGKACFWNLGMKTLTFGKKFIDFHQKFVIEDIFSENFSKSENPKSKMLIIPVVNFKCFRFLIFEKSQLKSLTFSIFDFQISENYRKSYFRSWIFDENQ